MEGKRQIGSKLPNVGTTIFAIMSELSHKHKAINLAQGFPDFPCSEKLISLVNFYMNKGLNQYSPMPGILPLREIIGEKTKELYNAVFDPQKEITITCGATEACYAAITSLIQKDDEVIIFEPAFDCYVPAIHLSGGKPVFVELHYPEYKIDWVEVKAKLTARTKMIIVNSPHNPTGSVLSPTDLDQLTELVKGTDILILSDEVYEHIIFDKKIHESVLRRPALRDRSLVISSFGKTFHTTGWRMGYCLAPEHLSAEFRKVHQFLTYSASTPVQYALADYLKEKDKYLDLPDFYQKKRDAFTMMMQNSRFKFIPSGGTYFQLMSYKSITDENDISYAARLTKETGVASIPVSVFFNNKRDDKILRFCFAKENETLERAAEKLCRI
jgi:methionine aminotransferase